jgi:subtilase family serine protease
MAPNATIYDVMQPFNLTGIGDNAVNLELYYMLNVVDPNIVSGSWAELQFHHDQGFADIYNNIGLQAVVEGITIFLGSGDSHDLNYLTVMGSKYIVTVGGIHPELNSSGEIVNQYAWYNPSGEWYGGPTGSGGGQSYFFPIPGFEKNYSIRVNGTNNMEGLPDLSMPASELITFGLGEYMTGDGTSYATPILAGMMASIESGISKDRNLTSRLGWIQPMLFNLSYGKVWGNNSYMNVSYTEPGSWVGSDMYLGTGWNAYTGIGSINAYNLYIDIKNYDSR